MTAPALPTRAETPVRLRHALRAHGIEAPLRIAGCAVVDAVASLAALGDWAVGAARRRTRRRARAARRIERWARAAGALKGPFAKAGQLVSLRLDVVAPEARAALEALQDRVPPLPFATITRCLERELGGPLERHFARIDPEPIGAASIAQVHAAELHDGTPVAVKVMYPWIEAALPHDLRLLRRGLRLVAGGADDLDRLFDEFADAVRDELDFEREARAARTIAENLSEHRGVLVPTIFDALSTRRVLTMSRHDGLRIDDVERLTAASVDRRRLVEILGRAYGQQVFEDGLFHADPHPGNLFVVGAEDDGDVPPKVLFVDFGLCRELAPELRQAMREAILALLRKDVGTFVDRMDAMDMIADGARPEIERRVAELFDRIAGGGGALGMSGDQVLDLKDEAKRLLAETPGLQLPNDLLLYARTLSYLFALCERLEPDVDVMRIAVPYLLRFLARREPESAVSGPDADPGVG